MTELTPERKNYKNAWLRNAYAKDPEKYRAKAALWRANNREKSRAAVRKHVLSHPKENMYRSKKCQAKRLGIEFTIRFQDIDWPELCPALGIKLVYQRWRGSVRRPYDDSPSFDRINPALGYIRGNVQIISNRANRIKADATAEELMKMALWASQTPGAASAAP